MNEMYYEAVNEFIEWADKNSITSINLLDFRIITHFFKSDQISHRKLQKYILNIIKEAEKTKPVPEEIKNKFLLCFL